MKKQLLLTLPLVAGIIGMNAVIASEVAADRALDYEALADASYNFDNETDFMADDGYWVIHPINCGLVLTPKKFGEDKVINKYRLGNNLRCQSANQQDAAITLYGNEVTLDLNKKTVDCQYFTTEFGPSAGISMQGLRGKLEGNHYESDEEVSLNDKHLGVINNCLIGVQVGENIDLNALPIPSGENIVTRVQTTLCDVGINVQNNDNHIYRNVLHCGFGDFNEESKAKFDNVYAGINLGSMGCGEVRCAAQAAGLNADIAPAPGNVYRNRVEYNLAYANIIGFSTGNNSGVIIHRKDANLFLHNIAQSNYGTGFYVSGSNAILERNLSVYNEGNGFAYGGSGIVPHFHGNYFNTPLAIFKKNRAFLNLEHGFTAGGNTIDVYDTNGAEFLDNTAFLNGDGSNYKDLYDSNNECSPGYYRLYDRNAWERNNAGTANPPCTRG
jgi:hypothetical protein